MNVQISKQHLEWAITLSERLTGKKESLPVLSCVVIEVEQKRVTMRATNLEAGLEVSVFGKIEDGGTVAVPASVLRETIRTIPGEMVTLKEVDGNLSVEARGSKNLLKTIPHEEFPGLPKGGSRKGFPISRERLLHALQSVFYAASPSMIRPELGSIYLSIEEGAVVTVATDSFRLAEKTVKGATKERRGGFADSTSTCARTSLYPGAHGR
jgi:DNA polymerase-3 subunit beta